MKEQLLSVLENSRNYTISVAEAMPDDSYNFKPENAASNFGELLNHTAYGIKWWEENYIKGIKTAWEPPIVKSGRKETIQSLTNAYESLKNTINSIELNDDSINGFHATIDHITHHRGQTVLYLRCKGIVPPEYVY
jgi:uncharacterized damage-inducible protein DinB